MSLKTITATVGEGGANIPSDVATVQYLLNCVPVSYGGPIRELKIDGFAGVVTIEAISRFKKAHFGQSNNRVDSAQSGGATLGELKKYDPLPYSAPVILPNFKPSNSQSMDPSKMNRGINSPNQIGTIYVKKSIDGGGIKRALDGVKRMIEGVKGRL